MGDRFKQWAPMLWVAVVLHGFGCTRSTADAHRGAANVLVHALKFRDIQSMYVTVTGASLSEPLVVPLASRGNQYSAIVSSLPVGRDFTFTASAKDQNGVVLYHGSVANQTILKNQTAIIVINMNQVTPGVGYSNQAPIIRSISASATTVGPGDTVEITAAARDPDLGQTDLLVFSWSATCGSFLSTATSNGTELVDSTSQITYSAPLVDGDCAIDLSVTDPYGIKNVSSFVITVTSANDTGNGKITVRPNTVPVISGLTADPVPLVKGRNTNLGVAATDAEGDAMTYHWATSCPGVLSTPTQATTGFMLNPSSTEASCNFSVIVTDGTWPDGSPKGIITNSLTLPVGSALVMTAPVFGTVYQTHDTIEGGDQVGVALVAFDPAGGLLTYAWTATAGSGPVVVSATELGLDASIFTNAIKWTAPAGAENGSPVKLTVTVTSTISHLVSTYAVSLAPLNSYCRGQADGTNCTTAARGGDKCVTWATCQAGACVPSTTVACPAGANSCKTNACNPVSGLCVLQNKADNTPCSDGNACTTSDACNNGQCGGSQLVCIPEFTCAPATGVCAPTVPNNPPAIIGLDASL